MSPHLQLPPEYDPLVVAISSMFSVAVLVGAFINLRLAHYVRSQWHTLPHRLKRITDRAWSPAQTACLGLGLAAVFLAVSLAAQVGWLPPWDQEAKSVRLLPLLVQTLALPLAGFSMMYACPPRAARKPGPPSAGIVYSIGSGILLYLASVPLVIASAAIHSIALRAAGYPIEPQAVVTLLSGNELPAWCVAYVLVLAIGVAPVFEEMLFRGILLPVVLKAARPLLAVVFVSFAFAIAHFHLPALAPLFVIAFMMAAGYVWTGSLLVPITIHAMFNGVNIALLYLLRDTGLLNPPAL